MINTANLFIQAYTEKTSSLRHFAYNGEFPEAAAILKDFESEFRSHFSEAPESQRGMYPLNKRSH